MFGDVKGTLCGRLLTPPLFFFYLRANSVIFRKKILKEFVMNKTKKLLIGLLSATCLTAGAFGLTACDNGNDKQTEHSDIYAVYQTYTAYAESRGDAVLSYEDWLATIKG